jgi:D-alanyl-D-alanine carboxypeptidase (penicillin-binding protein 5/6)
MHLLRSLGALALFSGSLLAAAAAQKVKHTTPVEGVYAGAITIDAASGAVLFQENADVVNPPASMTKLMTFAVVSDKLKDGALTLQTPVQITDQDSKMGGTQVYLDPREIFPVEELLYAMMIQSANDAAHALSRAAGGSTPAFVELMNAKARALGMTHTTFRTPHGLPPPSRKLEDGDVTTPRDFALLCRYLIQNTDVLKYTAVRDRDFGAARAKGPQHMRNHNNLLGKIPGVDGLKTGYTQLAGYCLSATAERNGRRVITVIMGSFGPGGQIDKGRARDLKAMELLETGFAALPAASATPAIPKTGAPLSPPTRPAAAPATGPAKSPEIVTIKTDKTASPSTPATEQSSTKSDPVVFHIPSLEKKP